MAMSVDGRYACFSRRARATSNRDLYLFPGYSTHYSLNDVYQSIFRLNGKPVCQYRRIVTYFCETDAVPNGENHLVAIDFASRQAVQFPLWPVFLEEMTAQNHNTEA